MADLRSVVRTGRVAAAVVAAILVISAPARPADSLFAGPDRPTWDFSLAGYYTVLPEDNDYIIWMATADHGWLHLEARYNYEDLKTASAFVGWNLSTGTELTLDMTPMAGVAYGSTGGIVPGLECSLGYRAFDFYGELEYFIETDGVSSDFLYSWLELGAMPAEVVRVGLSTQRTRVRDSPLEIDRGVFVQLTPEFGAGSLYAFNLFTESWFLLVGFEFAW